MLSLTNNRSCPLLSADHRMHFLFIDIIIMYSISYIYVTFILFLYIYGTPHLLASIRQQPHCLSGTTCSISWVCMLRSLTWINHVKLSTLNFGFFSIRLIWPACFHFITHTLTHRKDEGWDSYMNKKNSSCATSITLMHYCVKLEKHGVGEELWAITSSIGSVWSSSKHGVVFFFLLLNVISIEFLATYEWKLCILYVFYRGKIFGKKPRYKNKGIKMYCASTIMQEIKQFH